jgi:hypothetical protein
MACSRDFPDPEHLHSVYRTVSTQRRHNTHLSGSLNRAGVEKSLASPDLSSKGFSRMQYSEAEPVVRVAVPYTLSSPEMVGKNQFQ